MSKLKLRSLIAAGALAIATATTSVAGATPAEQATVLAVMNQHRAAHGLAPVVANGTLAASAENYAAYMANANFFSHRGLDGSTMRSRNQAAGYVGWSWLGENLAAGRTSPQQTVADWMNSPGHRAVILSPSAVECGVGHAYNASSRYRNYWTLECGAKW